MCPPVFAHTYYARNATRLHLHGTKLLHTTHTGRQFPSIQRNVTTQQSLAAYTEYTNSEFTIDMTEYAKGK